MRENDSIQRQQTANLQQLLSTDLIDQFLDQHKNELDYASWEDLLSRVAQAGLTPINHGELGIHLERIRQERTHNPPRRKRRSSSSVDDIQTVDRYGTAVWTDPEDFAERRLYEPGDFWLGRCPVTGQPLGYRDESHIWINSGTRGGKGSSVVVPNHLLWKGSLVSVDPKGENATVCAARRSMGNDVCAGMGQFVAVIDPMGCASVDPKYRVSYNPLDTLSADDPKLVEKAARMAEAIVIRPEKEGDAAFFNDKAKEFIESLILHVVTAEEYEGRRTMNLVFELATRGDREHAELFDKLNHEADERAGRELNPNTINPIDALLRVMKANDACGGVIAGAAEELHDLRMEKVNNQWGGIRGSLTQHLAFMRSEKIRECMEPTNRFTLSDLRHHPGGMSLFLCLNIDDMKTYNRWLRLMLTVICYELRASDERMATGHPLLMCLDEFATLGRFELISEGFSTLAGYSVKMMIVTQYIQQLQEHYEKSWHTFLANTGLRMFFNADEKSAKEVSEWIGETEVLVGAENYTINASEQDSVGRGMSQGVAETEGHGGSEGESVSDAHSTGTQDTVSEGEGIAEAHGTQRSRAHTDSQTTNESDGVTTSSGGHQGENYSRQDGFNDGWDGRWGRNWLDKRFAFFRQSDRRGVSGGTTRGGQSGVSWNEARSWQKGRGRGQSDTVSEGLQRTLTKSQHTNRSHSTSSQDTHTNTKSRSTNWNKQVSHNQGATVNQNHSRTLGGAISWNNTVQKRALIPPNDLVREFAKLEEGDPYHPGLALVKIPNENPVIVHRTLYYEDLGFDGLYDRHPRYPHTDPQSLTRIGKVHLELPRGSLWYKDEDELIHWPTISLWYKKPGERVRKGEPLFAIKPGLCHACGYDDTLTFHAPFSGTLKERHVGGDGEIEHEEVAAASVEFYLPELWDEAEQEVVNHEIDRYIIGEHQVLERNRREMSARKQLMLIPQVQFKPVFMAPPSPPMEPAGELAVESQPIDTTTIDPDSARELIDLDRGEFQEYRLVTLLLSIASIWLIYLAVMFALRPSAQLEQSRPVTEDDRPWHYKYDIESMNNRASSNDSVPVIKWSTDGWQAERDEFDRAVKAWGGVKTAEDVNKYDQLLVERSARRDAMNTAMLVSPAVAIGMMIGLGFLWTRFLENAWYRQTENLSAGKLAIRDARRTQWFNGEEHLYLLAIPIGLGGFIFGALGFDGWERLGGAIGFGLLGIITGLVISFLANLIRRVIWACNEGELVGWDKKVIPFNPKLSNH